MDIREKTCIVIRRNGEYLVGRMMLSHGLRWSCSLYDAWQTRDMEKARKIARATGGIMVLFNPIVGQEKIIGT